MGAWSGCSAPSATREKTLPPVIHVAGTNGRVPLSPTCGRSPRLRAQRPRADLAHLVRFSERIRVAGKLISDERLIELTERLERVNDGQPISFFEITAVLALTAFAETPADLCIVEVGLGGRFDATNVFEAPAVSVITPIDYDHVEFLGSELSRIAWEKAGIIKRGRPVVCARQYGGSPGGHRARGRRPDGAAHFDWARLRAPGRSAAG
jgi:dihydrofolate synthase/folylpolyglutamate synthase